MRYRYKKPFGFRLTNPPKALLKTQLDNIAIVPASLLGVKALWQTAANTLPQGGVFLCYAEENTRQKKILERVEETFREQGHIVRSLSMREVYSRWREIRACNDNACGESKSQNSQDSLLGPHILNRCY